MGLTIEEAAECTGIGRNTMRKLVDWGKLPVLKVGRKAIIRRDTLEQFMSVNQGRKLPKSTLDIDMAEFRHMRNLMIKVQDKAVKIKNLQDKVLPQLKQQLADTKGLFQRQRTQSFGGKIKEAEAEIADRLDKIPDTLKSEIIVGI